jgi:hypothetical protein
MLISNTITNCHILLLNNLVNFYELVLNISILIQKNINISTGCDAYEFLMTSIILSINK